MSTTPTNVGRAFVTFIVLWFFWGLMCLAGTGVLVYVALHFIAKWW